jgi:hypothetical protein
VWKTIEPARQNRTLWYGWSCRPYRSPGPFAQDLGAEHPSTSNAAIASDRVADPGVT